MVKSENDSKRPQKHVKADVIILGCSLPGIVAAHKLKSRFGDTMAIVVLDLIRPSRVASKCGVAFLDNVGDDDEEEPDLETLEERTVRHIDNVVRRYINMYAKTFNIPLPDPIMSPERNKSSFNKIFQHVNGKIVQCLKGYHDFEYLNLIQKFELNQYQSLLDQNMCDIFQIHKGNTESDRKIMLYYDQTTMEQHICDALFFSTSRDIMRTIVRLVCGAPAHSVSVLFYLHQCYRTSGSRNHLDGNNTRFREKLLGYCRKHLAVKLQQSIADITLTAMSIKEIRTYSDEQVILKTMKGESNYVCNLLAMALRPDQLSDIRIDNKLLSESEAEIIKAMISGKAKKFMIQYEENIWQAQGFSGDILSLQGPILWAMERPKLSMTGSKDKYASMVGYLKVSNKNSEEDSKVAVLEQLVKLFGKKAENPVNYKETEIDDVFIPRAGDYVALTKLTDEGSSRHVEWGALDIFADGDTAAALEAGHIAYLHLVNCLRPQAQTYEDVSAIDWTVLSTDPLEKLLCMINYKSSMRFIIYTSVICVGVHLIKSYFRK